MVGSVLASFLTNWSPLPTASGCSTKCDRDKIDEKKKKPKSKKAVALESEPEDSDDENWGH